MNAYLIYLTDCREFHAAYSDKVTPLQETNASFNCYPKWIIKNVGYSLQNIQ